LVFSFAAVFCGRHTHRSGAENKQEKSAIELQKLLTGACIVQFRALSDSHPRAWMQLIQNPDPSMALFFGLRVEHKADLAAHNSGHIPSWRLSSFVQATYASYRPTSEIGDDRTTGHLCFICSIDPTTQDGCC